jgi:hypothetical protein
MRLQASSINGSAKQVLPALCLVTDNVGDAIYVHGPRIGTYFQVTRLNIDDMVSVPSLGIIIQKIDTTHCLVQLRGLVSGIYTGLTPNQQLFVDTTGRLTHLIPPAPTPSIGKRCIQTMGYALDVAVFYLDPKSPIIRVS